MITVIGPSTARARYEVNCDVHGHLGSQTSRYYGEERVRCHRDEGCTAMAMYADRLKDKRWFAWCALCFKQKEYATRAPALAWMRHHYSEHISKAAGMGAR